LPEPLSFSALIKFIDIVSPRACRGVPPSRVATLIVIQSEAKNPQGQTSVVASKTHCLAMCICLFIDLK